MIGLEQRTNVQKANHIHDELSYLDQHTKCHLRHTITTLSLNTDIVSF